MTVGAESHDIPRVRGSSRIAGNSDKVMGIEQRNVILPALDTLPIIASLYELTQLEPFMACVTE